MTRRVWKSFRPTSLAMAIRGCKDFALDVHHMSVERIADRMAVTHDVLYKWLANGRMPAILIPTYELACGCNFVTTWLATSAGKLVVDMPRGRHAAPAELMALNSAFAGALQLLTAFYADPVPSDAEATLAALRAHMEHVAYHHHNVARFASPELDF
ncbi:TPA: hypothetical protein QDC22_007529 [Burkholderia stabilis]|nr:hypothetical protein [Burkholderia stabilis]HDR9589140.1 hypothetical protein [Burkholderia stabilis]HDR9649536.1 hypothetical protein [Burkholderia stabilis]HDR9653602.1 hypothetical protein [Burkholderia stabilis]HDR9656297.1 hypothetical protein [Burkholderia stabilis]